MTKDTQAVGVKRNQEAEQLEAQIGREMTRDERLAFDIGFNAGAHYGLERAREIIRVVEKEGAR